MAIQCKQHCMQQGCHAPNPNPTLPCACEQVPIFPPLQSAADFDAAACLALVRAAVGDPAADVSIAGVRTWTMSAQVADRFQVRAPGRGWWGRRGARARRIVGHDILPGSRSFHVCSLLEHVSTCTLEQL